MNDKLPENFGIKPPISEDMTSFATTGEWLKTSFYKTKDHWGVILLSGLIYLFVMLILEAPMQVFSTFVKPQVIGEKWRMVQEIEWGLLVGGVVIIFLALFFLNYLKTFMLAGYQRYVLAVIRGESDPWDRMMEGLKGSVLSLFLYLSVATLITLIGFCCFILPGIYFAVCYSYAPLFIVDRKLSFWEGMETSRKQVHRKWFRVFWYLILNVFVIFSGVILLLIGLFFTLPMSLVGHLMIYENLLKEERKGSTVIPKRGDYPEVFAANLCVFPGLGTWLAGKTGTGMMQMGGALIGSLFVIYGLVESLKQWGRLSESEVLWGISKQGILYLVMGLVVVKCFWFWGLWSGWSYKKESQAREVTEEATETQK